MSKSIKHLPRIIIEVIPHDQHRYPTVGDWFTDKEGNLVIRVSELSDWRREYLIALHELVEVMQCRQDGVTEKEVDRFDMAYERRRPEGDVSEPGDDAKAPYRDQHCLATGVERIAAASLGVCWSDYADELEGLS
jgi:hypothetical protein